MHFSGGVDVPVCVSSLQALGKASPFGAGIVRHALCGANHTEQRFRDWTIKPRTDGTLRFSDEVLTRGRIDGLCKMQLTAADGRVRECGLEETRFHMWWECDSTADVRRAFPGALELWHEYRDANDDDHVLRPLVEHGLAPACDVKAGDPTVQEIT